jgi:hypothetical protein
MSKYVKNDTVNGGAINELLGILVPLATRKSIPGGAKSAEAVKDATTVINELLEVIDRLADSGRSMLAEIEELKSVKTKVVGLQLTEDAKGFDTTVPGLVQGDRYMATEIDFANDQVVHHAISSDNVAVRYICTKQGHLLQRLEYGEGRSSYTIHTPTPYNMPEHLRNARADSAVMVSDLLREIDRAFFTDYHIGQDRTDLIRVTQRWISDLFARVTTGEGSDMAKVRQWVVELLGKLDGNTSSLSDLVEAVEPTKPVEPRFWASDDKQKAKELGVWLVNKEWVEWLDKETEGYTFDFGDQAHRDIFRKELLRRIRTVMGQPDNQQIRVMIDWDCYEHDIRDRNIWFTVPGFIFGPEPWNEVTLFNGIPL